MKHIMRNIIAIVVLIAVVYFVSNYAGVIQEQIGVKGASSQRAQGIAGQISSDVGTQVDAAREQVMQVKLADIVNGFSRFQRIPQDITNVKDYIQEQCDQVVHSRKK